MLQVLKTRFSGLIDSTIRFPLTVLFLVIQAVLTAIDISNNGEMMPYILTCVIGALSGMAVQAAHERFFSGLAQRALLYAVGLGVVALFYLSIAQLPESSVEIVIRTAVTGFALFIAFVWLGVIRSKYGFHESFMAAFKAVFQSLFFSGILVLGCMAIIAAIDRLITPVDSNAYAHTANIVFTIFAPLLVLSLIPIYPGRAARPPEAESALTANIVHRTSSPKFMEVLLSYIIIPLASVFTVILLVYILLNIGGKFWTDNLLEPMLIAYTVTVIVVTILAGGLDNKFALIFGKIFPKVLIPIALFQVAASILILVDTGVTFGRYYVILYGAFAVIAGVVFSLLPIRKSGIIAIVLIALSVISLVPPTDAFTVSSNSQIATLENTLVKNGMLQADGIVPNGNISEDDKTKIISVVQYLDSTDDLDRLTWLPDNLNGYEDNVFYETFGFHIYQNTQPKFQYVSVYFDMNGVIPISGYDALTRLNLPSPVTGTLQESFVVGGETYSLFTETDAVSVKLIVKDELGQELGRFDTTEIYARYDTYTPETPELTLEEASFTSKNDQLELTIIVLDASFNKDAERGDQYARVLVLIRIK